MIRKVSREKGNPKWGVEISWHGHSCFSLRDSTGRTVVIDPYDETVGLERLQLKADALLITHNHFDHNFFRGVKPRLLDLDIVQSSGAANVASDLLVYGIESDHDAEKGRIHGPNLIYIFTLAGLRCVHLGDIGQNDFTDFQKKLMGPVDVLFIPVGGVTTWDAEQAKKAVDELQPMAVFPMHYGNVRFYRFDPLQKFTDLFSPSQVIVTNSNSIKIKESERTNAPNIYILTPLSQN